MTQPNELRRIREGCAKLLGYTISKREPKLSVSDGRKYYYQGQIHYWMDDCGPQRDYWNPLEENSPHALEVLKWCAERADSRGRHLVVNVNRLADKKVWDVSEYDADGALYETGCGPTLEQATCLLALALSKEGV